MSQEKNYNTIEKLYRALFEAEAAGNKEEEERIRKEIEMITEPSLLRHFFFEVRNKKFFRVMKAFLYKDITDIEVAIMLSSFITHALIQMEKDGVEAYKELDILGMTKLLSEFIGGSTDVSTVRETIRRLYGPYL